MRSPTRIVLALTLTLGALIGLVPAAQAGTSDQTYRDRVGMIAAAASRRPAARGSVPGLVVVRNGREVYARNADRAMAPASLLKLLTTTAAILRFGGDHRFLTRVVGRTPAADGTVVGPLTLVGGGDPTFATAAFARRNFIRDAPSGTVTVFPSGSPTIEKLADRIVAAGVTRIDGDLVADESLFDRDRWQRGWVASYQRYPIDVGNLSALPVNTGLADDSGRSVSSSPAATAAVWLRNALVARGVKISGSIRFGRPAADPVEITRVESPPLREIVGWTNRWSVNYAAEMLLKSLGARFGGAGTTAAGAAVVRSTLQSKAVDVGGLRMEDGSGLSLLNSLKPRTIAQTLQLMATLPGQDGTALRDSLPIAGRPGTLLRRMRQSPAAGNLRGKTGLIRRVRAMAGWVRTRDGSFVVYVSLFNTVRRPIRMTSVLDAFGQSLAMLPG